MRTRFALAVAIVGLVLSGCAAAPHAPTDDRLTLRCDSPSSLGAAIRADVRSVAVAGGTIAGETPGLPWRSLTVETAERPIRVDVELTDGTELTGTVDCNLRGSTEQCDEVWTQAEQALAAPRGATLRCTDIPGLDGKIASGLTSGTTATVVLTRPIFQKYEGVPWVVAVHETGHLYTNSATPEQLARHYAVLGTTAEAYCTGDYHDQPCERFAQSLAVHLAGGEANGWAIYDRETTMRALDALRH